MSPRSATTADLTTCRTLTGSSRKVQAFLQRHTLKSTSTGWRWKWNTDRPAGGFQKNGHVFNKNSVAGGGIPEYLESISHTGARSKWERCRELPLYRSMPISFIS